jgi:hypothetical protein
MNHVISGAKHAVRAIREHFTFRVFWICAFLIFIAHADSAQNVMAIWCGVSKREFRKPREISQHDVNA